MLTEVFNGWMRGRLIVARCLSADVSGWMVGPGELAWATYALRLGEQAQIASDAAPMFTGIIEETGRVISFTRESTAWRLVVAADVALQNVAVGDSIAVNGCCLTVVEFAEDRLSFDLLEETRRLTSIISAETGSSLNLERSLRFDGKVGGHFVTGHIDGVGTIDVFEKRGADHYLRVRTPAGGGRLIVHKGSIAIDGISLTVAEVEGDSFAVWLIPHTVQLTNLHGKRAGDSVNLEFDLLGKYVDKLLVHPQPKNV